VLKGAEEPIGNVVETVGKLAQAASKMPYYRFNNMWNRQMQGAVRDEEDDFAMVELLTKTQAEGLLFWGWLGGYKYEGGQVKCGRLLTIEELGEILHSTHPQQRRLQDVDFAQSRSTSRIATSSTSRSKSTSSLSSRSSRNWYAPRRLTLGNLQH
jgi:hypothetical protein